MDASQIRIMDDEQLVDAIEDKRVEIFNLRFQKAAVQMEDTNALRYAKRELARLMTVQHERVLAAELAREENNDAE